ncbi:unnamed protein product [Nesidiocoris tenuis]|uniref:CCHC-type domain-containing protein n=1 Tax=Nesidiocoris tenuis TaxID=355587 RepID=A0A6H5H226_9HEMI|nr:unnamed protein product [Nesidiocoris tenuis]
MVPRVSLSIRPRSSNRPRSHVRSRSSSRSRSSHRSQDREEPKPSKCFGCGDFHWRKDCPFRSSVCPKCSRTGHSGKFCRNSRRTSSRNDYSRQISEEINSQISTSQNFIAERQPSEYQPASAVTYFGDYESYNCVGEISIAKRPPPAITVLVNGKPLRMELDTGGVCSMVNKNTLARIIPNYELLPTSRSFVSYTKNRFQCLGYVPVDVTFRQRTRSVNLYVAPFDTDNIFGREWISEFADLLSFEEFFKISDPGPKIPSTLDNKRTSFCGLNPILQKFEKPDIKRRMDDRGLNACTSNFRTFSPGDRVLFAPSPEVDCRRRVRIFEALSPEGAHRASVEAVAGRRPSFQPRSSRAPPSMPSSNGGSSSQNPLSLAAPSAAPLERRYPERDRRPRKMFTPS